MDPSRIEEMHDRLQGLRDHVPDLELVVLFGSTAKGRRRAGSDVDVAVRCVGPADLDVFHGVLAPALGTDRLDFVDLRRVSPLLAVERVLQEAIEAALDVNAHLIAELGHDVADDYFGGFVKLGQLGVLSEESAGVRAPSAELSNHLVHEYDALDNAKVLAAVGTLLDLYPRYIQAMEAELIRLEG